MHKHLPVCEPMLAGNELKYITDAVSTGWISSAGSYVTAFEKAFAEYCGVKHGIAVCNGTVALHLDDVRHTSCYTSFLQRIQAKAR